MIDREAVYSALWNLASKAANFTTTSRRLRHWADVNPKEQPALFMTQRRNVGVTNQGAVDTPIVWTLEAEFYIYVHSSDPYPAPAAILNPLIDAVELALAPDPWTGTQNLGLPAMVRWVRLNGNIETSEGVLGDQIMAVIPVEVRCLA